MKPEVRFGDPEEAMRDYLKAKWLPRSEPYKPAQSAFTNSFPKNALTGDATHVQIELDGTPSVEGYPAVERCTVRFTVWSAKGKPSNAKEAATRTEAFVYSHPGDAKVWSTKRLTGRLKGTDQASGNEFVSFTARVNMRPTAL